ncbi:MAG TPA: type II toxin-antitoxin system HicA family toxin [Rhodospirillales bacterium]|mgnify:FL=1|nr:type II toxin-antitoxin system HicA family toxin [Rhodospirillales bacterium]
MTALPVVRPEAVIRALERAGFIVERVKGSHHALKHPDKPHLHVTVPFHKRDMPRGTLRAIIKQAGLTTDEFVELL